MDISLDYISFALGAGTALLLFAYWIIKGFTAKNQDKEIAALQTRLEIEQQTISTAREELSNQFKVLSQEALSQSSESFLKLAQEKLKQSQNDSAHDLNRRQTAIDEMVKPIKEHLKKLEESLNTVKGTDQSLMEQIQHLQKTTSRIDGALRNPRHQGEWGEKVLEVILEHSGLMKGVHFETQKTLEIDGQKLRPDAIITLGDGLKIIVDAKAPIHDFSSALSDVDDETQYREITQALARQLRHHVQELKKRSYWEGIENVDFTVLFLPSEHVFSAAIQADPALIDYAAEHKIIIVSPTLMISLLKVVNFSWRQVELAENAAKISVAGAELHKRLSKFTEYLAKMGRGLNQALNSYDEAIGSFEARVLPQAKAMEDLHITSQSDTGIEALPKIGKTVRNVTKLAENDITEDSTLIELQDKQRK